MSILGSVFTGAYQVAGDRIAPTISGQAFITSESTLLIDEADPFAWGIR